MKTGFISEKWGFFKECKHTGGHVLKNSVNVLLALLHTKLATSFKKGLPMVTGVHF